MVKSTYAYQVVVLAWWLVVCQRGDLWFEWTSSIGHTKRENSYMCLSTSEQYGASQVLLQVKCHSTGHELLCFVTVEYYYKWSVILRVMRAYVSCSLCIIPSESVILRVTRAYVSCSLCINTLLHYISPTIYIIITTSAIYEDPTLEYIVTLLHYISPTIYIIITTSGLLHTHINVLLHFCTIPYPQVLY